MSKKFILVMSALALMTTGVRAQYCATDEVNNRLKAEYPEIAKYEQQLEQEISRKLGKLDLSKLAKTTDSMDNTVLHVPIVFHVVHNYGSVGYVSDNEIYETVKQINVMYSKKNADTADVVPAYKGNIPGTKTRYIGKANIEFHLATKDPSGNPTHGITRRRSYLSTEASDFAKFDVWAPDAYLNIWIIEKFNSSHADAAAYAYKPPAAAQLYYWDGAISLASFMNQDNTLTHEIGHCLNLDHPWGSTNAPEVGCGDDNVDDTPPTKGHNPSFCATADLVDSSCASGYLKNYSPAESWALYGDSSYTLVNYPDTVNSQNIMDYTYCSRMFTHGQVLRMRAALQSTVANRANLITAANLTATGALATRPDLAPIPAFQINKTGASITDIAPFDKVYGLALPSVQFQFRDRSWNDTIVANGITFSFTNSPSNNNLTMNAGTTGTTSFGDPGWVTVTQSATGNNSGTTTKEFPRSLYVASTTPVNPSGNAYFQEFSGADTAQWPTFNYFQNKWKWEIVSDAGYYDNFSIRYRGIDNRSTADFFTGYPAGNFDDFFSPVFDLTNSVYANNCNLNFMYAGATRSGYTFDMNDAFTIYYSTNGGNNWNLLKSYTGPAVAPNGTHATEFKPSGAWDWKMASIAIPAAAKSSQTIFRFRFTQGNYANSNMGSGNDFYLDRIHISEFPVGIDESKFTKGSISVVPNPTHEGAKLIVNGGTGTGEVVITDVTGKVVYRSTETLNGNITTIEIPQSAVSVKGMYLVQFSNNNERKTEKLIVY